MKEITVVNEDNYPVIVHENKKVIRPKSAIVSSK